MAAHWPSASSTPPEVHRHQLSSGIGIGVGMGQRRDARLRSMSPAHAATTAVATQLPTRLPSARAMRMNQSTHSTSTNPIAGIAGYQGIP